MSSIIVDDNESDFIVGKSKKESSIPDRSSYIPSTGYGSSSMLLFTTLTPLHPLFEIFFALPCRFTIYTHSSISRKGERLWQTIRQLFSGSLIHETINCIGLRKYWHFQTLSPNSMQRKLLRQGVHPRGISYRRVTQGPTQVEILRRQEM